MIEFKKNKKHHYSNGKWLIYKKLNWWYLYGKIDGEYSDYCGMYPTLKKAKDDAEKLDKIGYGT